MKLGDMKCPWQPDKTIRQCVTIHEGPPLTVRHINDLKTTERGLIGTQRRMT